MDPPGAALTLKSVESITDLDRWFETRAAQENELIYVGQQLWSSFAEFVDACDSERSIHITKDRTQERPKFRVLCVDDREPKITCIDATAGRAEWSYTNYRWDFGEPATWDGVVYFGSGDGMLTALRVADGEPVWRTECPSIVTTRPCASDHLVFVGCSTGSVTAFAKETGEAKWICESGWNGGAIQQVLEGNGTIVAYSSDGQCCGIALDDGRLMWSTKLASETKLHSFESLFVGSTKNDDQRIKELWAIDVLTGEMAWSYRLPKAATSYTVADPYLIYLTDIFDEDDLEPRLVILQTDAADASRPPVEAQNIPMPKVMSADDILVDNNGLLYGTDSLKVLASTLIHVSSIG